MLLEYKLGKEKHYTSFAEILQEEVIQEIKEQGWKEIINPETGDKY